LAFHRFGRPKHVDGAVHADLGGLHGVMPIVNRRGRTGEIVNFVDLDIKREVTSCRLSSKRGMIAQWATFDLVPVKKLSTQKDVVALSEQSVAQMGTQETGADGDQNSFYVTSSASRSKTSAPARTTLDSRYTEQLLREDGS
jgi:hypothetical protein